MEDTQDVGGRLDGLLDHLEEEVAARRMKREPWFCSVERSLASSGTRQPRKALPGTTVTQLVYARPAAGRCCR